MTRLQVRSFASREWINRKQRRNMSPMRVGTRWPDHRALAIVVEYLLQIITCRQCWVATDGIVVEMFSLADKVGLVVGIANDQSIAWGCAKAFRARNVTGGVHYVDGGFSITG